MTNLKSSFWSRFLLMVLFFLGAGLIYAQENSEDLKSINRWNFFLGGGYGYSESRAGLIDVQAEVQFTISSNVLFGLGIGYLSDSDSDHMGGHFNNISGGMMGGRQNMTGGYNGHRHDFRVIPLTLSLYYFLPVNSRIDVFMTAGAGYYWVSLNDVSTQRQNALGPHTGFGFEFKVADRITILAQGVYRFVNLDGFTSELHPGYREEMGGEEHVEGFWHHHHGHGEYHFHESHEEQEQMMEDNTPFNISLNGFSLRAGIKFGF